MEWVRRSTDAVSRLKRTIMMFPPATTLALSFLGQYNSNNTTALGIAAIEAHFANAGLVPALLSSFNPSAVMNVAFPGVGAVSPGQSLSVQQTVAAPNLTIVPANASVSPAGNFTVVLVDAHVVSTNESAGQVLHWLVNYVTLQNDSSCSPSSLSMNVSIAGGVVVTDYVGPQPPEGSGSHRYVVLLLPPTVLVLTSREPDQCQLWPINLFPSHRLHIDQSSWPAHRGHVF
ncbi:phosphatidylethanolamine-binding protein [Russula ochroleuca]|jgi:phosphatidylethanolamine-binding protein (PEBP) family uncharacterized protein|uniref:Phosphatidylethanolamine-binding protein n=1 Tax=Russula ochroleuca TaxID=152965 RepID=A0A9P5JWS0_9AGAM|nr:phosphatidylethanolamine-binding protein [Russula ochroleuca]